MPNRTYTIEAPNGQTYTLEGPEGASKETLINVLMRKKPEAAKPPERSWKDYAKMGLRAAGQGLGDIVKGAEMVADLNPVNALPNLALKALGYNKPSIAPHLDTAGERVAKRLNLPKPATRKEKLGSEIVRGVTSAAVPAAGAEALALRGARAVVPGIARRVGAQLISGGASGGAGEQVRQMGGGAAEQVAASLGAGMLPALPKLVTTGGSKLASYVTKGGATERAAKEITENTYRPQEAISAIQSRAQPVPGTKPVTAEVARDPNLAALHRARRTTPVSEQQNLNAQILGRGINTTMGPGDVADLSTLGKRTVAAGDEALAAAQGRVGPVVEPGDVGGRARKRFMAMYEAAKAKTAAAYNAPPLTNPRQVQIKEDFLTSLPKHLDDFYGSSGGYMKDDVRTVIDDFMGSTGFDPANPAEMFTSTRDIANIDSRLADLAGRAKMSGARKEAAFAQGLRRTIMDNIEGGLPDDVRQALKAAKSARLDQGRRFEQGRIGRDLAQKKYGESRVDDALLPETLVRPGTQGGVSADQLLSTIGPNATEEVVRARLRRLVDEGKLGTEAKVTNFNELLKRFSGVRKDVEAVVERGALNKELAKSPLGVLASDATDPAEHIATLLNRGDNGIAFKGLVEQVKSSGSKEALNGLRRAMAEYVKKSGGVARLDLSGFPIPAENATREALDTVLLHGGDLISPEQRTALSAVRQQLAATNYAGHSGVKAADDASFGSIPAVSGTTARTIRAIVEKFNNQKQVDALIDKALLEPDFALELLKRPTADRKAKIMRSLRAHATGTIAASSTQEE